MIKTRFKESDLPICKAHSDAYWCLVMKELASAVRQVLDGAKAAYLINPWPDQASFYRIHANSLAD